MRGLIRHFWDEATNVCHALGNYRVPFKSGRGVTQGGPLSAKLFNIIVNALLREWHRIVRANLDVADKEESNQMMAMLFAIFYVDDAYMAARDPVFLKSRGHIRLHWPRDQYCEDPGDDMHAREDSHPAVVGVVPADADGTVTASGWEACIVTCRECGKQMRNSSLGCHLADVHDIY